MHLGPRGPEKICLRRSGQLSHSFLFKTLLSESFSWFYLSFNSLVCSYSICSVPKLFRCLSTREYFCGIGHSKIQVLFEYNESIADDPYYDCQYLVATNKPVIMNSVISACFLKLIFQVKCPIIACS